MNVIVNPGYHLITPGKTHQPGEAVELDDAEAKRLIASGVVRAAETGSSNSSEGKPLNATQTVELVLATETIEALETFSADTRKTVMDAVAKRKAELEATV